MTSHGLGQPSLAHLVIFSPTLSLPTPPKPAGHDDHAERDRDLEDDLKEAAKIFFYTSLKSRGVSRDTMLRQVGLVKGLMGFAE